ncbi:uncharacterized protein LOC129013542 isoform X1 [Pongo pygmaeus]|uniref:uncharacterized protein LOC129013542 isoform X1 n=1 Tax=Pongo pygmaeus TaxID=9600 RepID=UPI00300C3BDE
MSSFCSPRWWPWSRTCIGATGPMSVSISPESSPWCAEAQALPGALVSCTELVSSSAQVVPLVLMGIGFGSRESQGSPVSMTVNSSAQVGPLTLTGIDGELRGRLALGPVDLGQCLSARSPAPDALKFRPFLEPWSPALSCDGEPGGRLALGLLCPSQRPSARWPGPVVLKLGPFLVPWSPSWS